MPEGRDDLKKAIYEGVTVGLTATLALLIPLGVLVIIVCVFIRFFGLE
jgi:hypothetical protein